MKKYITILFILLSFKITWADDCSSSCQINYAPAQALQEYISNQRTVISRITSLSYSKRDSSEINKIWNEFTKWINKILNYDNFNYNFDFFIKEVTWIYPTQIKRDKALIENELNRLQTYIEKSTKYWYSQVELKKEDICEWIDNCNLNWKVLDILLELSKNNSKILSLYENSIMWTNTTRDDFIIVSNNFYYDMVTAYNKTTVESCSKCEWWFMDKIKKAFDEISYNMKYTWEATKYWKDAWNLLTWNMSEQELRQIEKDLLIKELSHQWLSKDQAAIILNNLDEFNKNWWYSVKNNFLVNSLNSWITYITKFIEPFKSFIINMKESWKKEVPLSEVKTEVDINDNTQTLYQWLQETYTKLNNEIWEQTNIDEATLNKLVQIHITLAKITENLKNTVDLSKSVCEKQCSWVWNCTNY